MIQLFVNVDADGNIKKEYSGENIIAEENFDFHFLTDQETVDNLPNLKIVMNGMKKSLVLKDEVGGGS
ncbi:hypothetical protein DHX103_14495 [Planococcus sp. X10-3]|uniref:hypothetical protein n=1 Tax=Planococcus sp. X10-3 TaxID=3061240 RepID=UPI003BAEBFDA